MAKKKAGTAPATETPAEQPPPEHRPQGQVNGSGGGRTPPVHEARIGRIKATVWQNFTKEGERWFSVTVVRTYKDAGGNYKTANSFGRDDLLVLAECSRLAFLFIAHQNGCKLDGAQLPQQPRPDAPTETSAPTTAASDNGDIPF